MQVIFQTCSFALNNNSNTQIFRGTQDKRERGVCGKTSTFIFENDFSCAHLAFISFSFFCFILFWKISSANVCDNSSSLKEIPKSKNKICP